MAHDPDIYFGRVIPRSYPVMAEAEEENMTVHPPCETCDSYRAFAAKREQHETFQLDQEPLDIQLAATNQALEFERAAHHLTATQRDSAYETLEAVLPVISETLTQIPRFQRPGLLALRERIENTLPAPVPSKACA